MKLSVVAFVALISLCGIVASCKKGDTGTANVQYSPWFRPDVYKKDTVFGIWGFKYDLAVPALTQNILDSGTVLVYAKLLGYNPAVWPTNQVAQMPLTVTYIQGGALNHDFWNALATPGNLRIRFQNDRNDYNVIATQHQFRYIIIPGGVPVNGRVAQLSYEQVCARYNIPL